MQKEGFPIEAEDAEALALAEEILNQYREAFEELAK